MGRAVAGAALQSHEAWVEGQALPSPGPRVRCNYQAPG